MGNSAGGRALKNGIMFHSDNYHVTTTRMKNGDIKIETQEYKESKFDVSKITGIPFIRPYVFFFSMLKEGWKSIITATLITMALLVGVLMFAYFSGSTEFIESKNSSQYSSLFVLIVLGIAFRFTKAAKYHGAEHMAISALEKGLHITNDIIVKQSRISRNCGTNLVVFMLLIKFTLEFAGMNPILSLLVCISVGFELFLLNDGWLYKLLTPFYMIGYTLQKYLLTAKPNNEQLEIAQVGMNKLKELEGWE